MPACRDSRKLSKIKDILSYLYDNIRTGHEKLYIGSVEYFSRTYKDFISPLYDDDGYYVVPSEQLERLINLTIDEISTITCPFDLEKEHQGGGEFLDKHCNNEDGMFVFNGDGSDFFKKLLYRCYNDVDGNYKDEAYIPHRLNIVELIRTIFQRALLIFKDNKIPDNRPSDYSIGEGVKDENKQLIKRRYGHHLFEGKVNEFLRNLPTRPGFDVIDGSGCGTRNRSGNGSIMGYHGSLDSPLNRKDLDSGEVCFGVEGECDAHNHSNYNKFMNSGVKDQILSPSLGSVQFMATTDGSLRGGLTMEFVGCPLTYSHAIEGYGKFQKRALEFGYTSSYDENRSGIHIHISKSYFKNEEEIGRLSKLIVSTSEETYRKGFGRDPNNGCNKSIDDGAEGEVVNGKHRIVETRDRYVCVNVENDFTVEIRCFNGNTNIVKDLKLVNIMLGVVRSYDGKRFLPLQAVQKVDELFNGLGD